MRHVVQWVYDDETGDLVAEIPRPDGAGDDQVGRVPLADVQEALALLVGMLGPEGLTRSAVLGADLAGKADLLFAALQAIAADEPSRPAIEIVTDSALTAATTPIDTGDLI